jgi:hypothetical protein
MSQYIDTAFGFSFWYPSGWTISATDPSRYLTKDIELVDQQGNGFTITELYSPSGYLSLPPVNGCGETYSYNVSTQEWLDGVYDCDSPSTTTADADERAPYTMSGLPIFDGVAGALDEYLVPLSASKFVEISYVGDAEYAVRLDALPLTQTIEAGTTAVPNNQVLQLEFESYPHK